MTNIDGGDAMGEIVGIRKRKDGRVEWLVFGWE